MDVAADCMRLIAKDKSLGRAYLTEILDRIDTYEGSGWTVFFARIRLPFRARWIQRCRFAKIAFDRDRII
jgi:hypothetical protein